jgi:hypothetical protein
MGVGGKGTSLDAPALRGESPPSTVSTFVVWLRPVQASGSERAGTPQAFLPGLSRRRGNSRSTARHAPSGSSAVGLCAKPG